MNAIACLIAAATLGVDTGWQPIVGGGFEYIIQLDSGNLEALQEGEEIVSEIPANLRNVRRYRITFGNGALPRLGTPQNDAADASSGARNIDGTRGNDAARGNDTFRGGPLETARRDEGNTFDNWPSRMSSGAREGKWPNSTEESNDDANAGQTEDDNATRPGLSEKRPFGRGAIERPGTNAKGTEEKSDNGSSWRTRPGFGEGASLPAKPGTPTKTPAGSAVETTPRPFLGDNQAHRLAGYRGEEGDARHKHDETSSSSETSPSDTEETTPAVKEPEKSWFTLTVTLLILFASLGGNAYLGYLLFGMRQQFAQVIDRLKNRGEAQPA